MAMLGESYQESRNCVYNKSEVKMMVNPPQIEELEFTFRCRIATYDKHELSKAHTFISDSLKQRLKDLVGQHGIVSNAESRMEQVCEKVVARATSDARYQYLRSSLRLTGTQSLSAPVKMCWRSYVKVH